MRIKMPGSYGKGEGRGGKRKERDGEDDRGISQMGVVQAVSQNPLMRLPINGEITRLGKAISARTPTPIRMAAPSAETSSYAHALHSPGEFAYRNKYYRNYDPDMHLTIYGRPKQTPGVSEAEPGAITEPGAAAGDYEYIFAFHGRRPGNPGDDELAFMHIPTENKAMIESNPQMLKTSEFLEDFVPKLKATGADIKFIGHSLGGYKAKLYGNKYGIDQELFNAHITPLNKFGDTNGAVSNFHTIEGDATNFKFLPSPGGVREGETHFLYPRPKGNAASGLKNHELESFAPAERVAVTEETEFASALKAAGGGSKALGAASGLLTAGIIGHDLYKKDYKQAGIDAIEAGAVVGLGAAGAAGVATYEFGKQAYGDFKTHRTGEGIKDIAEGAAMVIGAFTGPVGAVGALAFWGLAEGVDYLVHKVRDKHHNASNENTKDIDSRNQSSYHQDIQAKRDEEEREMREQRERVSEEVEKQRRFDEKNSMNNNRYSEEQEMAAQKRVIESQKARIGSAVA